MTQRNGVLIQLEHVSKTFQKGSTLVHAVDDVSLAIHAGEFLAIMAPSGCGKSTLLQLIGALETPTSGRIIFDGADLAQMNDRALSRFRNRHVGFVFQAYNLLPELTVLDNVVLPLYYAGVGKRERRERAMEALRQVGLADRAHHHPAELSGGQEQRAAIARALVSQPQIVLADEPTGNLDTHIRDQVMRLFRDLNARGTTLLIVTHDAEVGAAAQHILLMRDGRFVSHAVASGAQAVT